MVMSISNYMGGFLLGFSWYFTYNVHILFHLLSLYLHILHYSTKDQTLQLHYTSQITTLTHQCQNINITSIFC